LPKIIALINGFWNNFLQKLTFSEKDTFFEKFLPEMRCLRKFDTFAKKIAQILLKKRKFCQKFWQILCIIKNLRKMDFFVKN